MLAHRSTSPVRRLRVATLLGALTAAVFVLAGMVTTAAAAPQPAQDSPKRGTAYMGIGQSMHQGGPPEDGTVVGALTAGDGVQGVDVSNWQGSVDWASVRDSGIEFAWIKATEGISYKDPSFDTNYLESYYGDVIRGAYHFATPDTSSGAAQADYFTSNGGGWSRDGMTLPGVLDIEYNPYGSSCYGLSTTSMRSWISDFYDTYKARTSRDMVIYTTADWWDTCTGNWDGMSTRSPLWVANWTTASSPTMPIGFPTWTVWQYTSSGTVSGISGKVDREQFNGTRGRLLALANNT